MKISKLLNGFNFFCHGHASLELIDKSFNEEDWAYKKGIQGTKFHNKSKNLELITKSCKLLNRFNDFCHGHMLLKLKDYCFKVKVWVYKKVFQGTKPHKKSMNQVI